MTVTDVVVLRKVDRVTVDLQAVDKVTPVLRHREMVMKALAVVVKDREVLLRDQVAIKGREVAIKGLAVATEALAVVTKALEAAREAEADLEKSRSAAFCSDFAIVLVFPTTHGRKKQRDEAPKAKKKLAPPTTAILAD